MYSKTKDATKNINILQIKFILSIHYHDEHIFGINCPMCTRIKPQGSVI